MLNTEIDAKIAEARKSGDKSLLKVLQLIKAEFIKHKTSSKDAKLDEIQETKILMKMKEQWLDEFEMLCSNNRDGSQLMNEIQILEEFIPELPTEEEIKEYTRQVVLDFIDQSSSPLSMKDMKAIMNIVKERSPLADGGIIAKTFKEYLNGK